MAGFSQVKENSAKSEELAVIPEILTPDGDPYLDEVTGEPCTISVYGPESKAAKKADAAEFRGWAKRSGMPDFEDHVATRISKVAALVGEWTGWKLDSGEPAPCTPQNVRELLGAKHILAQVEAGIARHAAFLASRKANSASS